MFTAHDRLPGNFSLNILDDRSYITCMAKHDRHMATREKILDRGVMALKEGGYHGTGLKEVLEKIEVPKGSFYHYFESKEHFGAEVIRYFSEKFAERLDACLEDPNCDALSTLKGFFQDEIVQHEREGRLGCLIGNLGAELGNSPELCRKALSEGYHAMASRFEMALERAQGAGRIRKDISPRELADFLVNGWEGALLRMKVESSVQPLRRFTKLYFEEFLET
jgi:TetR/AcrR family transcriptional repressor of nem operon